LFGKEEDYVRPGTRAQFRSTQNPNRTFEARISNVLPQFDPATRTLKVRLEADNPDYALRPEMFVDVDFPIDLPPMLTIPSDALIDTGLRKTVFLDRGNGYFEPRFVETGRRFGDRIEVTKGLMEGERIVLSGNFLVDSESRIKLAAAGLPEDYVVDPVCGMGVDPRRAENKKSNYGGQTQYFCSDLCKGKFDLKPEQYRSQRTGGEDRSAGSTSRQSAPAGRPKLAKDLACGMDVDIAASGVVKAEYKGKTYYFCAPSCRESFLREPQKHLKGIASPTPLN
jgi:YHS domain-containing protein